MGEMMKQRLSWLDLTFLFGRAQQGHQESREQVFNFLWARLLVIAKYRVQESAEDIVQETLLIVHNRLPEFDTLEGLLSFTNQVLRNKIGNLYQGRDRQKQRAVDLEAVAEPSYHISAEMDGVELDRIMRESINRLGERKPGCRTILSCLYDGFDTGEISKAIGIPKSKLKVRTFRCREALRQILLQQYGLQF
jgi:RNA polymerase sigma factor (sigma-70 family)